MKIFNLTEGSRVYTCNVYLILGTDNAIPDVNTLVDVGRDPRVLERIREAPTGVGKKRIEQVVLTHGHYDHTEMLPAICEAFDPVIYAYSPQVAVNDRGAACADVRRMYNGETLKMGDRVFEVIHAPGHSNDSVCLFCEQDGVLFSGDAPVDIKAPDADYGEGYVMLLKKLRTRNIQSIYPGHGGAMTEGCTGMIRSTLRNVRAAHPE